MKTKLLSLFCIAASLSLSAVVKPAGYVNPLMGTDSKRELSNGNTVPSVAVPWGMNQWIPQTGKMGDGWAYTYHSDKIRGFKQTHRPSPWIGDFGQFSIMPVTRSLKIDEDSRASWFSHKSEEARPYYYKVYLSEYDVTTEITPTDRCAYFRFTFPEEDQSYVVIDGYDRGSWIRIIPEQRRVVGYSTRASGGVGQNFRNYFIVEFDKPFDYDYAWLNGNEIQEGKSELQDNHVGAVVGFKTKKGEKVGAKVATSFISLDQAEINLKEIGSRSFDEVKNEAEDTWNDILGTIEVQADDKEQLRTFYSCLYRTVLFPHKMHEVDAEGNTVHYSPSTDKVEPGYLYTGTGFWDTFRALFPLINMLWPDEGAKMQQGWLNFYRESGFYPEWSSPGHRNCMVGNNSASVVADGILKGLVAKEQAPEMYEGMLYGTTHVHPRQKSTGRLGHEYYNRLGYIPYDVDIDENVARTLEYAYDDWCICQVAKFLGRPQEEIDLYRNRAKNYVNVFDKEYNLMRGKNEDGTFQSPFSPFKWGDAFTEGNSLHYTWSVFHDVQGLIDLMGGRETFVTQLDTVFALPPVFDDSYYGGTIHEIREMEIANMGNYAHGNQPIQHMIYLYNWAGTPWKTQYWARETMDRMYHPTPDGYCGDEDNGQTSAWYVFSALGFYPVCPASGQYALGSPLFPKATINLANGNKVEISAPGNDSASRYVKSLALNGQDYSKCYVDYETLKGGAHLHFEMDTVPNTARGTADADAPYSLTRE